MAVIGIDLGTTYSVMAWIRDGRPVVIPNAEARELTPSMVGFDRGGNVFVGDLAEEHAVLDPTTTVRSSKRKMGTAHAYSIHWREYTPMNIAAFILEKLKRDACAYTGLSIDEAVITVPAHFSDAARRATEQAAEVAGLRVRHMINEPTAATLAYGVAQKRGERVMVWDLGGGTFDVSVLEFSGDVYEVLATAGDTELGGDDWREVLQGRLAQACQEYWGERSHEPRYAHRLLRIAEEAKKKLSALESTSINLPAPSHRFSETMPLPLVITRSEFEEWTRALCDRMLFPARQVLGDAGIRRKDLDRVILVGGAARMPMIRRLVAEFTDKVPYFDIDPDRAVALGAAIQAGILEGPLSKSIHVDVCPLSLGIETQGGLVTRLIERNSCIPVSKEHVFTTAVDHQTEVEIHVLQGEREIAKHNVSLVKFTLSGLAPASKGEPKIHVTFSIDVDGVLHVCARDLDGERELNVIVNSHNVNRAEIERLIHDANMHRECDQSAKEQILRCVRLDHLMQTAKQLAQDGRAIALIKEAGELLLRGDAAEIDRVSCALTDEIARHQ